MVFFGGIFLAPRAGKTPHRESRGNGAAPGSAEGRRFGRRTGAARLAGENILWG